MKTNILFKTKIEEKDYLINITSIGIDREVLTLLKIEYEDTETNEKYFYYDNDLTDEFVEMYNYEIQTSINTNTYSIDFIEELIKKAFKDPYFEKAIITFFEEFHNGE